MQKVLKCGGVESRSDTQVADEAPFLSARLVSWPAHAGSAPSPHFKAMPNLKVVPQSEPSPAEKVRQRIKRAPKPEAMIQCNRCGGREVVETKTGVVLKNGKPSGGTKQFICANCHSHGTRVVLA